MKDIYKNPIFYYILVPVLVSLWPLLVKTVYLPQAQKSLSDELNCCKDAETEIKKILALDPERLEFSGSKTVSDEFDYAIAVDKIANQCQIPETSYVLSSKPTKKSGEQKIQPAHISLKEVDIVRFAKFLSAFQFRWSKLQCDRLVIAQKKGLPNIWKVDLDFKYYHE